MERDSATDSGRNVWPGRSTRRRVLITGASGFLGSHLTRRLISGAQVYALGRSPESLATMPTSVAASLYPPTPEGLVHLVQEISPDHIVHLAAGYAKGHSAVGISEAVKANYEIPWLLLEGARRTSATFTYTSTYWLREVGGEVLPATAYASSKHALAVMAKFFADTFGVPVTEIVLYDTYGPHDSRDKLVPYLLQCALTEQVASLREPDSLVDLVYVDDVVDGLMTMLGSRAPEGFHRWAARSGCAIRIDQVLSVVRSVTGQPIPVAWTNERIPHRHLARETIAEGLTNWSPATQLEDGIARCWAAARGI